MPKVTIHPLERVVEAREGVTIMEAAHAEGLYWPTTCGGQGICTSCLCTIDAGGENLESMGRSETTTLTGELGVAQEVVHARQLRLACQARIRGDVEVTKRGVRAASESPAPLD
jgi:2Fe-2S ferredoxin